jgi:hypothetical protein
MIAVAVLAAALALAMPAHAQAPERGQTASVVPQSHSVAEADATLARVERERAAANNEYAASEAICYDKFFVTNCLDEAKEKRRAVLAQLRALEVEAEHFKRADSVARRDAELAERTRKDDEELARRQALPAKPVKDVENTPPKTPPKGRKIADREADHAARMKREAAATAAEADRRAASAARFEQKKIDSERRQAEVAKRVAETERKRAAKLEAEKKKAESAAAAAAAAAAKR